MLARDSNSGRQKSRYFHFFKKWTKNTLDYYAASILKCILINFLDLIKLII